MKKFIVFLMLYFFLIINVNASELNIYSKNMVLYNMNDDILVKEINKDEKIKVASLTKIMTTYVAIKKIDDINKKVILNKEIFNGLREANASVAGFRVGQEVTYEDLLYAVMLPSGADAANALAINLTGSTSNFVKLMNEEATNMKLKNTHFANITGLDNENHYSSVEDIACMLKKALENDLFKKIFTTSKYLTSDKSMTLYQTMSSSLKRNNINAIYISGGKTGYTTLAGRCLASTAYDKTNNINYLLVTAGAPIDKDYYHLLDAKNIYEYYFNNYKYHTLVDKNEQLVTLDTKYTKEDKVEIKAKKKIVKYMDNNFDKNKLVINYDGIKEVKYGHKIKEKLGIITILYDNEILTKYNVYLDKKLHFSLMKYIKSNAMWITLSLIIILVIIVIYKNKVIANK